MKVSFFIASLLFSGLAFAKDTRPPASVVKQGDNVIIQLTGPAAETLFRALDVPAVGEFGIVQRQVKKTESISCQQAILGDVPGTMSEPRFTCTIVESSK